MFFQGAGILVFLSLVLLMPARYIIDLFFGKEYYASHSWPRVLTCILIGLLVWIIGHSLNSESKKNEFAPVHAFMFVKMEYWAFAWVVAAVASIIA